MNVWQPFKEITSCALSGAPSRARQGHWCLEHWVNSTSKRNLSEDGIPFNPKECSREEQVGPQS